MEKKRPQRLYLQLATFSLTRTIIIGLYANSVVAAFLAGSLLVILVLCIRVE
jgi:hypothetical protein